MGLDKSGVAGIGNEAEDLYSAALDIFSEYKPPYGLLGGRDVEIVATSQTEGGPYEFTIYGDGSEYTALNSFELRGSMCVKELKEDQTLADLAEDDATSIINYAPHSLFSQIAVSFNGTTVSDLSSTLHAYKGYIVTHLSYNTGAKENQLKKAGYLDDTEGNAGSDPATNLALAKRRLKIKRSKKFFWAIPLHVPVFNVPKLLPDKIRIDIKLMRGINPDNFVLINKTPGTKKYKILIDDLKLCCRRIDVAEPARLALEKHWLNHTAILKVCHPKIHVFSIPPTYTAGSNPNFVRGQLPYQVIVFLVKHNAFNGDITENPYNFEPHNVTGVFLDRNNQPVPPSGYTPNFANGDVMRELSNFYKNLGVVGNTDIGISPKRWLNGSTFYVFDLTPDCDNGFTTRDPGTGILDLTVKFSTALTEAVTVGAMCINHEAIYIDHMRNVNKSWT